MIEMGRRGRRAIAIDLPGHGFATKSATIATTADDMASRVLETLDELALNRFAVVGTSIGGLIAAKIALAVPARVTHLALVGALGLGEMGEDRRRRLAATVLDRGRQGTAAKLERLLVNTDLVTEGWIAEEVAINNSPGATEFFERFAEYMRHRLDDDLVLDRLRDIQDVVPLLLLWGAEDRTVPAEFGRLAAASLTRSRFEVMGSVAHAPYFEAAERFVDLLDDFLDGAVPA
jgi:pimeloyl-ACP methyl ester carboxylesterase